jgi:formate hydrogenlyase subunit 4
MVAARLLDAVGLLVMPFVMSGVILRTKSLWSGRRGQPLLQPLFDVVRLLRKTPVYSSVSTPIFRIAPWVFLVTALGAGVLTPLSGSVALASFPYDFVWLAYLWGLGRVVVMLAALDTGSAFEGMGAAREATFSTLLEPAFFLVTGALCLSSGGHSLQQALVMPLQGSASFAVMLGCVAALAVLLQVETARMPVDDPTTHLELTMVHEVMVLDHSGPDLAAIQYGSAVKLYVVASFIVTLLSPFAGTVGVAAAAVNAGLCVLLAAAVGTVESLIARFKLRAVPRYIAAGLTAGAVALLATAWRSGGG